MIRLAVSSASGQAAHRQIVEQVKIALLTGTVRPGDMLPSIRDIKRDTGVTEAVARRAYADLAREGIVTPIHGKGIQVDERLSYERTQALVERYHVMVNDALARAQKEGLLLSCFARMLMSTAQGIERAAPPLVYTDATAELAQERAAVIARTWAIPVDGVSLEQLTGVLRADRQPTKILTSYYRHSEVLKIVGRGRVPVIPIGLSYSAPLVARITKLDRRAIVTLLFDPVDRARIHLMLEDFRRRFVDPPVRFQGRPYRTPRDLLHLQQRNESGLILVSNRLWASLPDRVTGLPGVMRVQLEFSPAQLEEARIAAEVIV